MKKLFVITFAVISLFALSSFARACACCAEPGTHIDWTGIPKSYQLEILDDMKLGKSAELYMTAAAFDTIKGIAGIESESNSIVDWGTFSIVDAYIKNTWRIDITTPGGRSGSLVLPRPAKMSIVWIDMRDKSEPNTEVTVYKEFQFNGTVRTGTGIFRQGLARPATYRLIFQGRGNMCDNASDFRHWHLDISGAKASYSFFGPMKSAG